MVRRVCREGERVLMGGKGKRRVETLVSAGGVVYRRVDGRIETVLCGRDNPLRWSLAKGTPGDGESLEETALREVREETGLEVQIQAPLASIEYWFTDWEGEVRYHKTVHFHLMAPVGGDVTQHDPEFDVVQWFPADEALKKLTYANEVGVLRQAMALISQTGQEAEMQLVGARVILREKRLEDAEQDYIWRSDPELARLDAAYPLTMSYDRYLKMFQDQLRFPTPGSHHFAIETEDGRFIGNCMYYDLDSVNLEAELGIVIGDRDYWSNSYGYDAVVTLLDHVFTEQKLNRVYLHTLEWNNRAQRCFTKCGFTPVKPVHRFSYDFILMEVRRQDWFAKAEERLAARRADRRPGATAPVGDEG